LHLIRVRLQHFVVVALEPITDRQLAWTPVAALAFLTNIQNVAARSIRVALTGYNRAGKKV